MFQQTKQVFDVEQRKVLLTLEESFALKGFAIIMMLFHHLFVNPERYPDGYEFSVLTQLIASYFKVCVPVFVFISGYGFSKTKKRSVREFLSRIKDFYLRYWIVFLIFIPLSVWNGTLNITPKSLVENVFAIKTTYSTEWWFVTVYIILLFVTPFLYRLSSRWIAVISGMVSASHFILYRLFSSEPWFYYVPDLSPIISYGLGFLSARHEREIISAMQALKYRFGKQVFYALFTLLTLATVMIGSRFLVSVYYTIPISICFLCWFNNQIPKMHNFFQNLGHRSTFMWLTHGFYCYTLIPEIIYAPRFPILILIWLLLLSYLTAVVLERILHFLSVNSIK